jgi:predicted phosphodiesterase
MKFVLLSDIHASSKNPIARKDKIFNTFFKKFEWVVNYAKKRNAYILQSGDFFDRPRDWHMLFAMMDFFEEEEPGEIFTVMGQHDSYMRSKIEHSPTTLGVLVKMGHIEVLDKEPLIVTDPEQIVYIYGVGWGQSIPEPKGKINILVVHKGIGEDSLFPGHIPDDPNHIVRLYRKYNLILAGDIHRQFVKIRKSTTLVNTGPILRRDGDEYNLKHRPSFFVWDSETFALEKIQIPHEDASKVLTRSHIEPKQTEEEFEEFTEQIQKTWGETKEQTSFSKVKKAINKIVKQSKASRKAKNIINEVLSDES